MLRLAYQSGGNSVISRLALIWASVGLLLAGLAAAPATDKSTAGSQEKPKMARLIDPDATAETVALWQALHRSRQRAVLFGHQKTNLEGLGWKGEPNRSDVKATTGDWAAVFGFGFQNRRDKKLAPVLRQRMLDAHAHGALIELSWHPNNPVTGGRYSDVQGGTIRAVLPGGKAHETLRTWLDELAELLLSLKDEQGRPIPLVFRPWHEHNGGWFWWGSKAGTADEYIQLWRFTVRYLRDEKNVHQLVYAISPNSALRSEENYLRLRFPGMEWVDVIGFDHYVGDATRMDRLLEDMRIVQRLADKHGKLAAATEVGWRNGLSKYDGNDFWGGKILPLLARDDAPKIAWLLTWRNGHEDHYWVPTDKMSKPAADDFRAFCEHPRIWLADDWKRFRAETPSQTGTEGEAP
jgi:mannan endo-1,4-beta-mannosidase